MQLATLRPLRTSPFSIHSFSSAQVTDDIVTFFDFATVADKAIKVHDIHSNGFCTPGGGTPGGGFIPGNPSENPRGLAEDLADLAKDEDQSGLKELLKKRHWIKGEGSCVDHSGGTNFSFVELSALRINTKAQREVQERLDRVKAEQDRLAADAAEELQMLKEVEAKNSKSNELLRKREEYMQIAHSFDIPRTSPHREHEPWRSL